MSVPKLGYLVSLFLCHLLLLLNQVDSKCQKSFRCGNLTMEFPFSDNKDPGCGLIMVGGCDSEQPVIISADGRFNQNYSILDMLPPNRLRIREPEIESLQRKRHCRFLRNLSLSRSPSLSFKFSNSNLTLFSCYNQSKSDAIEELFHGYSRIECEVAGVYYRTAPTDARTAGASFGVGCTVIQLPVNSSRDDDDLYDMLEPEFTLEWSVDAKCEECYDRGGQCLANSRNEFFCKEADSNCQKPFDCGVLPMEFPFSNVKEPGCGLIMVNQCDSDSPKILSEDGRPRFTLLNTTQPNKLTVRDDDLLYQIVTGCLLPGNVSLSHSPSLSSTVSGPNITFFVCLNTMYGGEPKDEQFKNYHNTTCGGSTLYYKTPATNVPTPQERDITPECSMIQLPVNSDQAMDELIHQLKTVYTIEWSVSEECSKCYRRGGQCLSNGWNEFRCKGGGNKLKLILGISGGVLSFFLCLVIIFMVLRRRKSKGGYFLSRNISSSPSSKSDIEGGSFYFGIPIFSYEELEKATNKFDQTKELGDGGFGTVYYGRLEDGREVAIKRLYEHNYRRVEQFLNEIKILTCLRHPNLVSLYGCTSRRSRELLLVYEYISNGTVADHLHGERAKEAPLSWPVRMSIAIETATALAYLHNSDIIHRDVKTNNILLDANFCVKVADFGLSRLFPIDCTHISTAPQGTPGYVDPEYHQCYQLTDRSDVYSFGVVLIELISSMPAVDISRHRHEINLANLAMNRIQRCAFDELIDPSLGYDTDPEVTRMTTSVAELAFRCLQLEKDLRPSMDEVVCFLKEIKYGEDCDFEQMKGAAAPGKIPPSPETDDAVLLKSKAFQSSPTAVTDAWVSSDSTTASSVG